MDRWVDVWMDGRTDERTDGWTEGCTVGCNDGSKERWVDADAWWTKAWWMGDVLASESLLTHPR